MPTYEYECKSCAYTFEAFQSMSDEPLKDCPQCGCEVRRLIHGGTGVIFKGAGFYVTDKSKSREGQGGKAVAADTTASGGAVASPPDGAAKQEKSPSGEGAKTAAQPAGEKAPAAGAK
jgi:putative FmdB family regulatory protein